MPEKTLHLKKSPIIYLFKVVWDTSILRHTYYRNMVNVKIKYNFIIFLFSKIFT